MTYYPIQVIGSVQSVDVIVVLFLHQGIHHHISSLIDLTEPILTELLCPGMEKSCFKRVRLIRCSVLLIVWLASIITLTILPALQRLHRTTETGAVEAGIWEVCEKVFHPELQLFRTPVGLESGYAAANILANSLELAGIFVFLASLIRILGVTEKRSQDLVSLKNSSILLVVGLATPYLLNFTSGAFLEWLTG